MAKPSAPSSSAPASSLGLMFALTAFVGVLVGAVGTYLLLRPQLRQAAAAAAVVASSPAPAAATAPEAAGGFALPPVGLTAGMTPAQAERTLGNFYYDQANWSDAASHYEAALKLGMDDPDIRTDLGNVYRFLHRPNDALAQYQRAQEMNPAHEFSLFNQGGLFFEDLNQKEKGVGIWREYLARFPQGRNVANARKLIAEASGGAAPVGPPAATAAPDAAKPAAPSEGEARMLQLIKAAATKPDKP